MTQPDGFTPDGALSDTGIADLAAKTQQDWEDELYGTVTDKLEPLEQLFSIVTQSFLGVAETVIGWFSTIVDLQGWLDVLGEVTGFFYDLLDRAAFFAVFDEVVGFFTWLFDQVSSVLGGAVDGVEDFLKPLTEFFVDLFNSFGEAFLPIVTAVVGLLSWLWGLVESVLGGAVDVVEDILKPVLQVILNLFELFGDAFLPIVQGVIGALKWLWDLVESVLGGAFDVVEDLLKPVLQAIVDLFELFGDAFLPIVTAAVGFLKWLWDQIESVLGGAVDAVEDFLKPVAEFFVNILDEFGALADGFPYLTRTVVNQLWSLFNGGTEGIGKTLNDVLISVGDFASNLIPQLTGVPGSLSLGDVGTWANNLLSRSLTWDDFKTIFGEIPESVIGVLPVANINVVNPELMALGGFDTSSTLPTGSNWEWDGTNTHTASGGSAKVTCDGAAHALYSNQSISVAAGDQLLISCYVKSTGTVGSGGITLSVIPFTGTTQGSTAVLASRASSASWVKLDGGTYTVGAGVTSIRVKVAVTSAAAAGSAVWFDDISVKKTGLMSGSWMQGQLGTIAADIQGAVDQIVKAIKGTGATGTLVGASIQTAVQDIFKTLFGPLITLLPTNLVSNPLLEIAIPGLQASKIVSGAFGSEQIGAGAVTETKLGSGAVTSGKLGTNAVTNNAIAPDAVTATEIQDGTITATLINSSAYPSIATALGTTPTTGSGGKMSRRNTTTKIQASTGNSKFISSFYDSVDQISTDIVASASTGRFTVTYAGYYIIEVGFTTNASVPGAGFFNVAPAVYKSGSNTPFKVGADALGSYGTVPVVNATFGNYARSAHSTFIVYLTAGAYVEAGYVNFGASNNNFFEGDTNGNSTFFSIAMLNRTSEG